MIILLVEASSQRGTFNTSINPCLEFKAAMPSIKPSSIKNDVLQTIPSNYHWTTMCWLFVVLFCFGLACGMQKFPGQRSIPYDSSDLSQSSDHARSLTCPTRKLLWQFEKWSNGLSICLFFFFLLQLHLQNMEFPRLGGELELQLQPMPQPRQHWILNPLIKARD